MVEGLRIAGTDPSPAWAAPIGFLFSLAFLGATQYVIEVTHFAIYWAHAAGTAAVFVYLAVHFSRISHVLFSPLNAFLRHTRPTGALRPMGDLTTLDRFGASEFTDFTWKQLLDFDACTNCGRCQDQCPAYASGKPLSLRKVVQDLRQYSTE